VFRYAEGHRGHCLEDVRHLGRRPHRELLGGRVDHDRSGFHERGDQPLLTKAAPHHDLVGVGLGGRERRVDVTAGARLTGVESPHRALVGAQIGMDERRPFPERLFHVQDRVERGVVDLDQFHGVFGDRGAAGHDDRDRVTGEVDPRRGQWMGWRRLLVRGDRPRVRQRDPVRPEIGGGVHRHHPGDLRGRIGVDRGDHGVCEGAADHGDVQHAGQHDVVGPLRAAGDQPLVLLTQPTPADLGDVQG
jgi:hypothetical protein